VSRVRKANLAAVGSNDFILYKLLTPLKRVPAKDILGRATKG